MVVATYIPSPAIIIGTVRVITTIVVSEAFPFFRFGHHLQKAFYPTIHNPDSERHSTMTGFTPDAPVLHEIRTTARNSPRQRPVSRPSQPSVTTAGIRSSTSHPMAVGSTIRTACASTRAVGTSSTSCTRMAPSGVRCIGVTSPPPTWSIGSANQSCSLLPWRRRRTACSPVPQ